MESMGILAFGAAATMQYLFSKQLPMELLTTISREASATVAVCSWMTLMMSGVTPGASVDAEAEVARRKMRAIMVSDLSRPVERIH